MIGDMIESLLFAKYRRLENQLVIFADDQVHKLYTADIYHITDILSDYTCNYIVMCCIKLSSLR
jgi:hypothetical protein